MALLRLLLLLFLCSSLAVQGRLLGCMTGNGCMREEEMAPPASENGNNIKMEEMKGLKPLERKSRGNLVGLDLRWVPSGPDPLHHSGSPRKPRTP